MYFIRLLLNDIVIVILRLAMVSLLSILFPIQCVLVPMGLNCFTAPIVCIVTNTLHRETVTKCYIQISPRKKLFFRVHSANKNSQMRTFAERFCLSSRWSFLSPWRFAEKLCKLLRSFSARFRADTPQKLRVISQNVNSLNFCFVWFLVLRPSQQLWSCRDGQLI